MNHSNSSCSDRLVSDGKWYSQLSALTWILWRASLPCTHPALSNCMREASFSHSSPSSSVVLHCILQMVFSSVWSAMRSLRLCSLPSANSMNDLPQQFELVASYLCLLRRSLCLLFAPLVPTALGHQSVHTTHVRPAHHSRLGSTI